MKSRDAIVASASMVLAMAVLAAAGPASAVRPASGSFYGFPGNYARADFVDRLDVTTLRVSRSGRSFAPTKLALCATRLRVSGPAGRASSVPIRRDGRFAAVGRAGPVRYSVRGRFIARDQARVSVARRGARCGRVVLYRHGVPPFSGCASQPAGTLLSSDTVRVFQQLTGSVVNGRAGFSAHVYGCLFDSPSKRFDLGKNVPPDETLEGFQSAGPMLAFFRGGCINCFFEQRYIEVRDLRDGSIVSRPDVPFLSRLPDLVLKANGSVAWTLERIAVGPNGYPIGYPGPAVIEAREVSALDSRGQRLLDSGLELVLDSLALNGSTLYWLNGTSARSASLD